MAKAQFVKRVSKLIMNSLVDELLQRMVISEGERESVKAVKEREGRAEAILDMVLGKGDQTCSVMMETLEDLDPYLHSSLSFT